MYMCGIYNSMYNLKKLATTRRCEEQSTRERMASVRALVISGH